MLPSFLVLLLLSSFSILVSSSPLFFNTGNSNLDLALGGATLGGLGGLFLGENLSYLNCPGHISFSQEVCLEVVGEEDGAEEVVEVLMTGEADMMIDGEVAVSRREVRGQ